MPLYEYVSQAGTTRELLASMSNPPPEFVFMFGDGSYRDAESGQLELEPDERDMLLELMQLPRDERVWRRVYGAGVSGHVPDFACRPGKDGLPVSVASCRRKGGKLVKRGDHVIREHDDGVHTNLAGQPIIDSNRAARENAKRTGMELD